MIFSSGYGGGCFHPIRPGEVLAVKQAKRDMWDDFPEEDEEEEEDMADDLISRQEVLEMLEYYQKDEEIDEQDFGFNHAIQTIRSDVMEMKTYSTKEDTAEWKEDNGDYFCSNCGYKYSALDEDGCPIPDNYCPNCGAKMKGDSE